MKTHATGFRSSLLALVAVAAIAAPALAGPPLLCHGYDIGTHTSLPWNGQSWQGHANDIDLKTLVPATERLLTPDTPFIVRMETLRRASLYASRDPKVAADLLARITARTRDAKAGKTDQSLALFDTGYLIETYRQIGMLGGYGDQIGTDTNAIARLVKDLDGSAMVQQVVAAKPDDPELQFSAAIVAKARERRETYRQHAAKARVAAKADTLIAQNMDKMREW